MYNWGILLPEAVDEGNVLSGDAESLIKELLYLKQLNLISLTLNSSNTVQNFFEFPNLVSITQSLCISYASQSSPLNILHLAHMEHPNELDISGIEFEELKIDSTADQVWKVLQIGFRNLHTFNISSCFNVKDLTWLTFAPKRKNLKISFCLEMEEIINVEKLSQVSETMGELNLFAQLESVYLSCAVDLKGIYPNPLLSTAKRN